MPVKKTKKPNKPFHQDKEGRVRIAYFKNKNKKGTKYIIFCLSLMAFPFKYCQKMYIPEVNRQQVIDLLSRQPEFKIKESKRKKKEKVE